MTLDRLQNDLNAASKAQDTLRVNTLTSLVSAAKAAAMEWRCRDRVPEPLVNEVVIRELMKVNDQIDMCPSFREDLIEEYKKKVEIIKEYAPEIMSRDEVTDYIKEHFANFVASKNKKALTDAVMADLRGKADTKIINRIIDNLC